MKLDGYEFDFKRMMYRCDYPNMTLWTSVTREVGGKWRKVLPQDSWDWDDLHHKVAARLEHAYQTYVRQLIEVGAGNDPL